MAKIDHAPKPDPDDGQEPALPPLIFSYTRAQAMADGVLIDVTTAAKEAGFVIPVAMTATAWSECVRVPAGVAGQSESGRLWDVLNLLRFAIRQSNGEAELLFQLHVRNDDTEGEPPLVTLKAVCGPGDDPSPCLTIMLPDED